MAWLSRLLVIKLAWLACSGVFLLFAHASSSSLQLVSLNDAAADLGAVCLDGSPPGYYFRQGKDEGAKSWILFFEGGGWCSSESDCLSRSHSDLGSSKDWQSHITLGGMFSDDPAVNPDFFNWNVAYMKYCDGASFSGDRDEPVKTDSGELLYYRGFRILWAILLDLRRWYDLATASQVLVSGCSAGGLAVTVHLDLIREFLGAVPKVAGVVDAGYFPNLNDLSGHPFYADHYIVSSFTMQNATGGMDDDCIAATPVASQWQCFMAQYNWPHITTPVYLVNSQYDSWQLPFILLAETDLTDWQACIAADPHSCANKTQLETINQYRTAYMQESLTPFFASQAGGFLHSCFVHCHTADDVLWTKIVSQGTALNRAVGDWYFKRSAVTRIVDDAWPSNPSCQTL